MAMKSGKDFDAEFDAYVAAYEHPTTEANTTNVGIMRKQHEAWEDAGVLDPDQPTPWSHYLYQRAMTTEFTPAERAALRVRMELEGWRA
jgi:hypothetical protein